MKGKCRAMLFAHPLISLNGVNVLLNIFLSYFHRAV